MIVMIKTVPYNVSEDGDCDGVLTKLMTVTTQTVRMLSLLVTVIRMVYWADDCDDVDPSLLAIANDGDCDGVLTADDCDDTDPIQPRC